MQSQLEYFIQLFTFAFTVALPEMTNAVLFSKYFVCEFYL